MTAAYISFGLVLGFPPSPASLFKKKTYFGPLLLYVVTIFISPFPFLTWAAPAGVEWHIDGEMMQKQMDVVVMETEHTQFDD